MSCVFGKNCILLKKRDFCWHKLTDYSRLKQILQISHSLESTVKMCDTARKLRDVSRFSTWMQIGNMSVLTHLCRDLFQIKERVFLCVFCLKWSTKSPDILFFHCIITFGTISFILDVERHYIVRKNCAVEKCVICCLLCHSL